MEHWTTYTALEKIVRRRWIWTTCSRFRGFLDTLEKKEAITAAEHKTLLALVDEIKPCMSQIKHNRRAADRS
jgi:hypothetical protein